MPASAYSTSFVRQPGFSGGPTLVWVSPAGYKSLIKCITIVWGNIDLSGMDAWLQDAAGTKFVRSTWFTTMGAYTNNGGTNLWWGSWVLEEGEELYAQAVSGTVDITASGYLLTT